MTIEEKNSWLFTFTQSNLIGSNPAGDLCYLPPTVRHHSSLTLDFENQV